jgi:WD40 repeat protein
VANRFFRLFFVLVVTWNGSILMAQQQPTQPTPPTKLFLNLVGTTEEGIGQANNVVFTPNNKRLVSAGPHGTIIIWDAITGKKTLRIQADTTEPHHQAVDIALSPDGKRLASTHEGVVKVWDSATGREVLRLRVDGPEAPRCLTFRPDGKYLACPGKGNTVQVWELATGQPALTLRRSTKPDNVRDFICALAYSLDGRLLAAADTTTGLVTVWNAAGGRIVHALDVRRSGGVWDMGFARCKVAFSPDGRHIATAGGDFDPVKVWEAASGKLLHRLEGGKALAFSADSRHIATATHEWLEISPGGQTEKMGGEIKVWELASGREVLSFKANSGPNICDLAFSPDSKRLAVINQEYTIKVWDVSRLLEQARPK